MLLAVNRRLSATRFDESAYTMHPAHRQADGVHELFLVAINNTQVGRSPPATERRFSSTMKQLLDIMVEHITTRRARMTRKTNGLHGP